MSEIWAMWESKVSDLFATHHLSLIAGKEQKFMTMFKQFVKVLLGPSVWGVTVYKLYAVYTCMGFMCSLLWCVCVEFRIAATRPRKVKFCCVVWHGIVTVL